MYIFEFLEKLQNDNQYITFLLARAPKSEPAVRKIVITGVYVSSIIFDHWVKP